MSNQRLYSTYQRIKNNCCPEWQSDSGSFYTWYWNQEKEQNNLCAYCGLPGNTKQYYGQWFRKCRRGRTLEVDRKDNNKCYSPSNCVLVCYPCNNAKSDVFSYEEFRKIGHIIGEIKKGERS